MCCFHLRAVRRSFYEQTAKVNPNLTSAVDHDLNLKLSEKGKPVYVKQAVYRYRLHENRISVKERKKQGKTFVDCSMAAIKRRGYQGKYYLSYTEDYISILLDERKYIRQPFSQKIFCIGLNRTGMRSLTRAIEMLGYNIIKNPRDLEVIEYFDAASDVLIAANYQNLDKAYPKSKFILTTRDIPSWLKSWRKHNRRSKRRFGDELPKWVQDFRIMLYGQVKFDRDVWKAKFNEHQTKAIDYFNRRPNDFMVFNIFENDGWQKLTQFLNINSPLELKIKESQTIAQNKFPAIKD